MHHEAHSAPIVSTHTHSHKRRLNDAQESALQGIIRTSLPGAHALPFSLWCKEAVRDLVHAQYGELLPERTLVSYIERWGFAAERPLVTAHKALPHQMRTWMRSDYPVISFQAKEQKAEIYWLGDHALQNTWSTDVNGRRIRTAYDHHMLFVVSNRGNAHWMVCKSAPTALELFSFLGKVISKRTRKMFLLVPSSEMVRSEACMQWVQQHRQQLEIHLLPKLS